MPCVSDSEKNPPLRPDAPNATVSASTTTMSADGSVARASMAAHRPVSPPPEVDHLLGDCSKAKKELGWEPKVDFRALVEMMVDADIARLSGAAPLTGPR